MRNSGFTLIEMVAVILILAILSAAMTAGLSSAREKAWRTQARETCRNICEAWTAYLLDVKKFPKEIGSKELPATYANMKWIVDADHNKVKRVYLEMTDEEKDTGKKNGLRDHWNQQLMFLLDTDYDGQVNNPWKDPTAEGSPLSQDKIKAHCVAWSNGNPKIDTKKKPSNAIVVSY